jgi:hypothetical protein
VVILAQTIFFASIAVAGFFLWYRFFSAKAKPGRKAGRAPAPGTKARTCPLCGANLDRGELVKSAVYPGNPAKLAHIFGCPYCYPAEGGRPRECPVCRKTLRPDSYLIALMFDKPGRKHVHVLGCTECHSDKK